MFERTENPQYPGTGNCTVFATEFYAPFEHARVLNTKLWFENTCMPKRRVKLVALKDNAISCTGVFLFILLLVVCIGIFTHLVITN